MIQSQQQCLTTPSPAKNKKINKTRLSSFDRPSLSRSNGNMRRSYSSASSPIPSTSPARSSSNSRSSSYSTLQSPLTSPNAIYQQPRSISSNASPRSAGSSSSTPGGTNRKKIATYSRTLPAPLTNNNDGIFLAPLPIQRSRSSVLSPFSTRLTNTRSIGGRENVRVIIRCRPVLNNESNNHVVVQTTKQQVTINGKNYNNNGNSGNISNLKQFSFDTVFDTSSTSQSIFSQSVIPLLDQALAGFNATIFAYGQTGSGKTYTMTGNLNNSSQFGIIPLAADYIFQTISDYTGDDIHTVHYSVMVSVVEIYNEKCYDLLGINNRISLDIREEINENIFYLPQLSRHLICTRLELMQLLKQSNEKRTESSTQQNEKSSRSHCIVTLYIEKTIKKINEKNNEEEIISVLNSKLSLIDLAGSEKLSSEKYNKQGQETLHINLSLSTLSQCISALTTTNSDKKGVIPYRNSTLTKLLKDALGGTALTLMIACINLLEDNITETVSTLRWASTAKKIKNKPIIHQHTNNLKEKRLKEEIQTLKQNLSEKNIYLLIVFHLLKFINNKNDLSNEIKDAIEGLLTIHNDQTSNIDTLSVQTKNHTTLVSAELTEQLIQQPINHPMLSSILSPAILQLKASNTPTSESSSSFMQLFVQECISVHNKFESTKENTSLSSYMYNPEEKIAGNTMISDDNGFDYIVSPARTTRQQSIGKVLSFTDTDILTSIASSPDSASYKSNKHDWDNHEQEQEDFSSLSYEPNGAVSSDETYSVQQCAETKESVAEASKDDDGEDEDIDKVKEELSRVRTALDNVVLSKIELVKTSSQELKRMKQLMHNSQTARLNTKRSLRDSCSIM